MKFAWLMEEIMQCRQMPVKIVMGYRAYSAYLRMLENENVKDFRDSRFMDIPVFCEPDVSPHNVYFIARISTWTPT